MSTALAELNFVQNPMVEDVIEPGLPETQSSLLDRLPFRRGFATALAAVALIGASEAEATSAYANTPTGVAREFATLFSKGKFIEACRLDINNCIGMDKRDTPPHPEFTPNKVFQVNPNFAHNTYPNSVMIEVHTPVYNKIGPWCMAVEKQDSRWKLIWNGFGSPKGNCTNHV